MHRSATAAAAALTLLAACSDAPVAGVDEPQATVLPAEGFPDAGEFHTGWVTGRDGDPMQVDYQIHDGLAVWEGDIILGAADRIAATREELLGPEGMRRGVIIDGSTYRWPGGVVPYTIDSNVPNQWRVTDAINYIEAVTSGVDFVPRTNQSNYIRVVRSSGCASYIGRIGGAQYLYLGDGCGSGNTAHEFLHALGMYHEQSRCDRDSYVTINWGNIASGYSSNFNSQCSGASDVSSYSEGSIMHYGPYAFSKNGQKTITSKRGLDHLMGQRSGMSSSDVSTINYMY